MNIGRAKKYRNTSQLFIGVNLLKIVGGRVPKALEWKRRRRRQEWGVWRGYPPFLLAWGLGPRKQFSILSFEMLNFYAFWTLEQGDSTATVITMFMTSAYQCRIDRPSSWGPRMPWGGLVHLHNLYNLLLRHWHAVLLHVSASTCSAAAAASCTNVGQQNVAEHLLTIMCTGSLGLTESFNHSTCDD